MSPPDRYPSICSSICPSIGFSSAPSNAGSSPPSNALSNAPSNAPSNARTYVLTDKSLKLDRYLQLDNARARVAKNPQVKGEISRLAAATRGLTPAAI